MPCSPRRRPTRSEDTKYLQRALALARRYQGRTHPNPTVGAVIVKDGKVIAEGVHVCCGKDHAERAALKKAGDAARGAEIFVTLEPCCHYGRTPPCTNALIEAGIKRVVVLNRDPNPIACDGASALQAAGIQVDFLCDTPEALEAVRMNAPFFKYATERLPFTTAKWAISADGVMSVPGKSIWFTGDAARKDSHKLRSSVDAVLVGIGTVLMDDPILDTRLAGGKRAPVKIVLDSRLKTPPSAKLLADGKTIVMHSPDAPKQNMAPLTDKGAEFVEIPSVDEGVALDTAMRRLAEMGLIHILLEAGPHLQSAFMDAGLVDELVVYRAPLLVGAGQTPLAHMKAEPPKLKHLSTKRLANDTKDVYAVNPLPDARLLYRWEERVLCSLE